MIVVNNGKLSENCTHQKYITLCTISINDIIQQMAQRCIPQVYFEPWTPGMFWECVNKAKKSHPTYPYDDKNSPYTLLVRLLYEVEELNKLVRIEN